MKKTFSLFLVLTSVILFLLSSNYMHSVRTQTISAIDSVDPVPLYPVMHMNPRIEHPTYVSYDSVFKNAGYYFTKNAFGQKEINTFFVPMFIPEQASFPAFADDPSFGLMGFSFNSIMPNALVLKARANKYGVNFSFTTW